MSWSHFSPRHHSREFQTDIDLCHQDPAPFLRGCLSTGIGCPEATLPPNLSADKSGYQKDIAVGVMHKRVHFPDRSVPWKLAKTEKEPRCGAILTDSCPRLPDKWDDSHCWAVRSLPKEWPSHISSWFVDAVASLSSPSWASQTLSLEWEFTCLWAGHRWGQGWYLTSQVGRLSHPALAI